MVQYSGGPRGKKRVATDDVQALAMRARAGDVAALTSLGNRLLTGDGVPAAPAEGMRLLQEAARQGGPEALALLARCAAFGVMREASLEEALVGLQRAAESGFEPSRRELQLLARHPGTDWAALRRQVDLASLTTPPAARAACDAPVIRVIEGFATADECAWLVARGSQDMHRARVYGHDVPGPREARSRTNSEADFTFSRADVMLAILRQRIAASVGKSSRCFEVAKLLRYQRGEQFSLHADYQEPDSPAQAVEIARHGQRVMTFLVYLNDDYAGGQTDFPQAGFRFRGQRGDALWFSNVDSRGAPDPKSVHAGLPPSSGTKWLLSQWVRDRPLA